MSEHAMLTDDNNSKFPPMHRILREVRRASRPGFGAACVWCGHANRRREYTRETEDAHLLECRSYPEEAKQQIREMQSRGQIDVD